MGSGNGYSTEPVCESEAKKANTRQQAIVVAKVGVSVSEAAEKMSVLVCVCGLRAVQSRRMREGRARTGSRSPKGPPKDRQKRSAERSIQGQRGDSTVEIGAAVARADGQRPISSALYSLSVQWHSPSLSGPTSLRLGAKPSTELPECQRHHAH